MRRTILIREKLAIYFLMLGIIVEVVLGTFYYFNARDALLDRTFNQLNSVRLEKKYRVEKFFEDRKNDMRILSNAEELIQSLKNLDNGVEDSIVSREFEDYYSMELKMFIREDLFCRKIMLISENKTLVYDVASSEISFKNQNNSVFQSIINKVRLDNQIHIADLMQIDDEVKLMVGSPIFEDHEFKGVLLLVIGIESINKMLLDDNPKYRLGESGETYLVGDDFLMRSTSRFLNNSELQTKVKTIGVKKVFEGITDSGIFDDYRGVKVLSSFGPLKIDGLNWAILSEIDFDEAMVPIFSIRNRIIILNLFLAMGIFIFAFFVATRISGPVVKLNNAANKVTSGDYSTFVNVKRKDELGELSDSFNRMTRQIDKQTKEIIREREYGLRAMINGQETERQRLSREIHDGLGQSLIALKLKLENLNNCMDKDRVDEYSDFLELIDGTIQETRNIINNLSPAVLSEFGLEMAINNMCREVEKQTGINFIFDSDEDIDFENISGLNSIFRIIQEGINNIAKHSGAKEASIQIFREENNLIITIEDNGIGFQYPQNEKEMKQFGLINMKERVVLLNGSFSIQTEKDRGTIITISIPQKSLDDE